MSMRLPYIVASRMDKNLWKNLEQDNFPVLIEGIHAAGWLLNCNPSERKIILRLHNVEHDYYRHLFRSSSSTINRIYYHFESVLLRKFEKKDCRHSAPYTRRVGAGRENVQTTVRCKKH